MADKTRRFKVGSTQPSASVLDELTGGTPAPSASAAPGPAPAVSAPRPVRVDPPVAAPVQRVPIRVQVAEGLADRVRAAVAALAYQVPEWSSLNAATAAALERFVADAEAEHNDGEPFPWQPGRQLQPGRRVGY
jgi:hypothetical protein